MTSRPIYLNDKELDVAVKALDVMFFNDGKFHKYNSDQATYNSAAALKLYKEKRRREKAKWRKND